MSRRASVGARILVALGLGALALAGAAPPAAAHAELVTTSPGDGVRLDAAPDRVEITFSEGVSATLGAVRVLDAAGDRVDTGGVEAHGGTVTVPVRDLADGAYIVAWRVISADSHPVNGSFTFVVGDGSQRIDDDLAASLLGEGGDGPWRVMGAAARALAYGGTLIAVGVAVFMTWAHDKGPEISVLRRVVRVAAAVGAVGVVVELPVRAALATGLGPGSLTEAGVAGQLLGDRVGLATAVALLVLLFVAVDGGRDRLLAVAGVVAVGVALAISGHTATTSPELVAVGSDAIHVGAGAVWLGGLVGCVMVVSSRRRAGTTAAPVVLSFSGVAGVALVAVAVAGSALAWTQVRSLDALTSTTYGRLLMAKVAIVGLVALLGGINRTRVVPILERGLERGQHDPPFATGRSTVTLLRRILAAEAALLFVAVAITAVLVDVIPARAAVAAPFAASAPLGDGRADIDVDPTRAGRTTIHIYAYDETGDPLELTEGVTVRFALPAADISGLERTPSPTGTGHWTLEGDELSIGGTWTIDIVARMTRFEAQTARFTVPIQP